MCVICVLIGCIRDRTRNLRGNSISRRREREPPTTLSRSKTCNWFFFSYFLVSRKSIPENKNVKRVRKCPRLHEIVIRPHGLHTSESMSKRNTARRSIYGFCSNREEMLICFFACSVYGCMSQETTDSHSQLLLCVPLFLIFYSLVLFLYFGLFCLLLFAIRDELS